MKKNRSDKYTIGICNTIRDTKELRFFFFELDPEHMEHKDFIQGIYDDNKLDYVMHKTGGGGIHFLSPTLITKFRWKRIMSTCKFVNPKCPMTTLRVKPNKYPNEDQIWYRTEIKEYSNEMKNSIEMSNYLNKIWKTNFKGEVHTELKIVNYPLPLPKLEVN